MKIVYIGHKEVKGDNVAATGLTWTRGQVQEVADEKKAAKLCEHKLIWKCVDGLKDKDIQALLLPELKAVVPDPVVRVIPEGDAFMEPFVMAVPVDMLRELHNKTLTAVFMKSADADAFADWRLERDTRPEDTAPVNTGPAVAPEKKADKKPAAGLEPAGGKKVA